MGNWYIVIKTINGCRYRYRQKTWRDGSKVRTRSEYLGPADAVGAADDQVRLGDMVTGTLYRCPTGYRHDANTTVLDVLKFESDELGNADILDQALRVASPDALQAMPARNAIWFTASRREARRYGTAVEAFTPPPGARVLAFDGDGGMLILIPPKDT